MEKIKSISSSILSYAKSIGIEHTEIWSCVSESKSVTTRMGNCETIDTGNNISIGIRIIIDNKQAVASYNLEDLKKNFEKYLDILKNIANNSTYDEYIEFRKEPDAVPNNNSLNLFDHDFSYQDNTKQIESLYQYALETEKLALSNKYITNSEGSTAGYSQSEILFITSTGIELSHKSTSFGSSLSILASDGNDSQIHYDGQEFRHWNQFIPVEEFVPNILEEAILKLNPIKIDSVSCPIILESKVAGSLLSTIISAINGHSIANSQSFLCNKLEESIASNEMTIIDDPTVIKGLNSYVFDAEGNIPYKKKLLDKGVLKSYILDLYTAKKLGLRSTANAARSSSSTPSPSSSNVYIENGTHNLKDLISNIKYGIYITDLFGMGIDIINDNFSQGASGLLIENGQLTNISVDKITLASQISNMMTNSRIANDLKIRYGLDSPSIYIDNAVIS